MTGCCFFFFFSFFFGLVKCPGDFCVVVTQRQRWLLLSPTEQTVVCQWAKLKRLPYSGRHGCSEQEETEGTLEIIPHVCQCNVVILDSPCQAISLIIVLIWNVGFISLSPPPPLHFCSFLFIFLLPPPPLSLLVTHSSINIGITITLDDCWETWAISCTHGLFSDRISGDHSWVFTDTVRHLHIITAARSWTLPVHTAQNSRGRYEYMFIKQTQLFVIPFYSILFYSRHATIWNILVTVIVAK